MMMSGDKSKWQAEYDALPDWAQKMVEALKTCSAYGVGDNAAIEVMSINRDKYSGFHMAISRDASELWFDGFSGAKELADALTAPWPPQAAPVRERRAVNLVELFTEGDEDNAFDQPCAFGHRVNGHAVYCHNEAWPNSPRKCRRNRDDYLHEECPGYVANPDVPKS